MFDYNLRPPADWFAQGCSWQCWLHGRCVVLSAVSGICQACFAVYLKQTARDQIVTAAVQAAVHGSATHLTRLAAPTALLLAAFWQCTPQTGPGMHGMHGPVMPLCGNSRVFGGSGAMRSHVRLVMAARDACGACGEEGAAGRALPWHGSRRLHRARSDTASQICCVAHSTSLCQQQTCVFTRQQLVQLLSVT